MDIVVQLLWIMTGLSSAYAHPLFYVDIYKTEIHVDGFLMSLFFFRIANSECSGSYLEETLST